MLDKRRELETSLLTLERVADKQWLENEIQKVQDIIADACAKEYSEKIKSHCKELTDTEGGFYNNGIWHLKKKICIQRPESLTSKKDSEGIIVTDPEKKIIIC